MFKSTKFDLKNSVIKCSLAKNIKFDFCGFNFDFKQNKVDDYQSPTLTASSGVRKTPEGLSFRQNRHHCLLALIQLLEDVELDFQIVEGRRATMSLPST